MARRATFSDSGRNHRYARGFAPSDSPTASRSVRSAALHLLSRRDYTTSELRKKLLDREYPADDIEELINKLTASGLLDDRRVAAAHLRTAAAIKGRGRLRIARELGARGISREMVTQVMAGLESQDEAAAIRKILVRKKWPPKPTRDEQRKMFQHLLRRGFPSDAISRALGRSRSEDDAESE